MANFFMRGFQKLQPFVGAISRSRFPLLISGATRWLAVPVIILVSAFVTNAIIILFCGYNPWEAYVAAINGAFGNGRKFGETLVKTTPFLMTGLSVAIAFRCGIWNIGAEGQFLVGALAATWFGTKVATLLPPQTWLAVPLGLIIAVFAGGIWGILPAILKVTRGVNEVISTIMLNYIAINFVGLMIDGGPLQELARHAPQSMRIVDWVFLPRLFPPPHRVNIGIIIAVLLAIVLTYLLFRTTFGYQLRAVGEGATAAEAAGISIVRNTLRVFFISGALAGLGGAIELMALTRRLYLGFSPGYGYTAIAVALLAKLHPLITVAAALLFGALTTGSYAMQRGVGISDKVTWVMQAVILLFVIGYSTVKFFHRQSERMAVGSQESAKRDNLDNKPN